MDLSPKDAGDLLALIGIIAAALAVLDWRIRAHVQQQTSHLFDRLRNEVETRTQPVQPGYHNGGQSLADLAQKLHRIEDTLAEIVTKKG